MRKFWILLGLILAACGGGSAETQRLESISCTAAFRADVSEPIEKEEKITFADSDAEQTIAFSEMVFHAAYSAGVADNERNLRVWVMDGADTTVYQSVLYQLPIDSGPQNQFAGGHGFSGLNYSYAPDSTAELQFWCEAG